VSATPRDTDRPLLRVEGLVTAFDTEGGVVRAVDGVDLTVEAGRTLGLVGESGCGKSVTALSIVGLLPRPAARIEAGRILFDGEDLARADEATLHRIRGRRIGMVFQEPMTALNPVQRIGRQVGEALRLHRGLDARAALARAVELLHDVGIPDPELRVSEYPHQLSGGMRQRAMIATALACDPDLLIADEPTTALDVTVQAQVLDLLGKLRRERSMGLLLITHDLGVIAENCDEVLVMYAGRVAERAPVTELFARPRHPYTRGLLASMPRLETPRKTRLPVIEGTVPSLATMPEGCRFAGRCPWRTERCTREVPALRTIAPNQAVACHHAEAIAGEPWR
jgi:oligopeptide/dipeptide ABC transporter ATP-binding protein